MKQSDCKITTYELINVKLLANSKQAIHFIKNIITNIILSIIIHNIIFYFNNHCHNYYSFIKNKKK